MLGGFDSHSANYSPIGEIYRKKEEKMDIELYCCYSLNLRDFLHENGLRYKLCALNPNSQKRFWVYIKDEKLDMLLNEWSSTTK